METEYTLPSPAPSRTSSDRVSSVRNADCVTDLLLAWNQGDPAALDALTPLVYEELRKLARFRFRAERADHTLQSTALVHEAFLKLVDQSRIRWRNRAHFYGIASRLMRRILVDHARAQKAIKRGSGHKLTLDEALAAAQERDVDLLALDIALQELAEMDPQQGQIVELRFFGGLTIEETSEVLSISPATVKREWTTAKAWLFSQLRSEGERPGLRSQQQEFLS